MTSSLLSSLSSVLYLQQYRGITLPLHYAPHDQYHRIGPASCFCRRESLVRKFDSGMLQVLQVGVCTCGVFFSVLTATRTDFYRLTLRVR